jgi:hypothetical protein
MQGGKGSGHRVESGGFGRGRVLEGVECLVSGRFVLRPWDASCISPNCLHNRKTTRGEGFEHTNALAYVPSTPKRGTGGFGSIVAAAA